MIIAITSEENKGLESLIGNHFGRCPFYIIVEVENEEVTSFEGIANPYAISHQPGMVPEFINKQNVDLVISGGMGRRAIEAFHAYNIKVATGASGTVKDTLKAYFDGNLQQDAACKESIEHQG